MSAGLNPQDKTLRLIRLSDGRRLAAAFMGDPRGRPVYMFHGFPGSRFQRPLDDILLLEKRILLVTFDRPGIGRSDPLSGRKLTDWPADVREAADQLDHRQFSMIGVSAGGPYALACARRLPNRVERAITVGGLSPMAPLRRRVSRLNTTALFFQMTNRFPAATRWGLKVMRATLRRRPALLPRAGSLTVREPDRSAVRDPRVKEFVQKDFLEAFHPGVEGSLVDARLLAQPWGFHPEKIEVPVSIMHGDRDTVVPPECAEILHEKIPSSRLRIIEGSGHYDLLLYRLEKVLGEVV